MWSCRIFPCDLGGASSEANTSSALMAELILEWVALSSCTFLLNEHVLLVTLFPAMNLAKRYWCLSWKENESWSDQLIWCQVVDSETAGSELMIKGFVFSKATNCFITQEGYEETQNQL